MMRLLFLEAISRQSHHLDNENEKCGGQYNIFPWKGRPARTIIAAAVGFIIMLARDPAHI